MPFLSFKGINHAYLLKRSVIHTKKRIILLNLLINCISARLAGQILSIEVEYTFCVSNFLIIGVCNSSASSWFELLLF